LGGGTPLTIIPNPPAAVLRSAWAFGGFVFWTANGILKTPATGGSTVTLAAVGQGHFDPTLLKVTAGAVYWTERAPSGSGEDYFIRAVSPSGGAATTLTTVTTTLPPQLGADGVFIYYVRQPSSGPAVLEKIPLAGGTPITVTTMAGPSGCASIASLANVAV